LWKKDTIDDSDMFCGTRYRSSAFKTYFILHVSSKLKKGWKTEDSTFLGQKSEKNYPNLEMKPYFSPAPRNRKMTIHGLKVAIFITVSLF
jgi:hypothetical protein